MIHDIRTALKSEGFEVVIAHNGVEALRAMQIERPDVVILDPTLTWLGGARRRQTSRRRSTGPPIIVFSPQAGGSAKVSPLGVAADDYVTRFFDAKEMLAHVKSLQRHALPPSREGIVRAGLLEVDLERWMVSVQGKAITLTAKEFGLLRMLLNAKGRVLMRGVLRQVVWDRGTAERFDSRTVDVHIGRLRRKLGLAGRYIMTVRGVGYRFGVSVEPTGTSNTNDP